MQITLSWAQTPYSLQIKKADSLYKIKQYYKAAITYQAALKINKQTTDADKRYNAACAWALAGNTGNAFENLNVIVGKTYFDYEHLIADTDLNTIHNDKRWLPLLQKIKEVKLSALSPDKLYQDFDLLVSAIRCS